MAMVVVVVDIIVEELGRGGVVVGVLRYGKMHRLQTWPLGLGEIIIVS